MVWDESNKKGNSKLMILMHSDLLLISSTLPIFDDLFEIAEYRNLLLLSFDF